MGTVAPSTMPEVGHDDPDQDISMPDAPDLPGQDVQEQPVDPSNASRLDILAAASATLPPNPLPASQNSAVDSASSDGDASSDADSAETPADSELNAATAPAAAAAAAAAAATAAAVATATAAGAATTTTAAAAAVADIAEPHLAHEPFAWRPIPEDTSQPSAEELEADGRPEVSAADHDHWFSQLRTMDDPDHAVEETVKFVWPIDRFNGTEENPSTSLVVHSDSFKLGGARWRLKLYPKGNETSYVSIYLECTSLHSGGAGVDDADAAFDDGGDADFAMDLLRPILPPLHLADGHSAAAARQLRRPRAFAVQFGMLMYNPVAEHVHYMKQSKHLFTRDNPDAGFARFGPGPVFELGRRRSGQLAPILQSDRLGFAIFVQLFRNPTGLLFRDPNGHDRACRQMKRTGLLDFDYGANGALVSGPSSLFSAVMILSLLAPVRKMLYAADKWAATLGGGDSKIPRKVRKPLLSALQDFLEDWRDHTDQTVKVDCDVQSALERHGHFDDDECDVVRTLLKLRNVLDKELLGSGLSVNALFPADGVRYKLPQDKTHNVRSGLKALIEALQMPDQQYPALLPVEIPRWAFNHHDRQWKRNDKPVTLNEVMRLTRDCSGTYRLYACVLHESGHKSMRFSTLIRPDLKTWYRFDNLRATSMPVTQLTAKQAMEQAHRWAYFALYVREDVAKQELLADSRQFLGEPERQWVSRKAVDPDTGIASRPPELRRLDKVRQLAKLRKKDKDTEMPDKAPEPVSAFVRVKYFNPFTQRLETPESEYVSIPIELHDRKSSHLALIDSVRPLLVHWPPKREVLLFQTPYLGDVAHGELTPEERRVWEKDCIFDRRHELLIRVETFVMQPKLSDAERELVTKNGGLPDGEDFMLHLLRRQEATGGTPPKADGEMLQDCLGQEYHKGASSRGEWHGKGYHIYFNGDVYDGEFRMGVRHGQGFQTFQNGDTYLGEWADGKMHGQGVYTQAATGNTYRGTFKDDKQHAPGTTTWRVAESRQRTCYVCYEKEQDAAFLDCGHVCACVECARKVSTCPICRRSVLRVLKIFYTT